MTCRESPKQTGGPGRRACSGGALGQRAVFSLLLFLDSNDAKWYSFPKNIIHKFIHYHSLFTPTFHDGAAAAAVLNVALVPALIHITIVVVL